MLLLLLLVCTVGGRILFNFMELEVEVGLVFDIRADANVCVVWGVVWGTEVGTGAEGPKRSDRASELKREK